MTNGNRIVRGFVTTDAVRFAHHILRDLVGEGASSRDSAIGMAPMARTVSRRVTGKMPAPLNSLNRQVQRPQESHRIVSKLGRSRRVPVSEANRTVRGYTAVVTLANAKLRTLSGADVFPAIFLSLREGEGVKIPRSTAQYER